LRGKLIAHIGETREAFAGNTEGRTIAVAMTG
jgi:hypothetical protein